MIHLILFSLEVACIIIGLWLGIIKIYQLLTGLDWTSAKADMQYFIRGWIKHEESFYVLCDPDCQARIGNLIESYAPPPISEVKWGSSIFQGLPCLYIRLPCCVDQRPLVASLVKEIVRETLENNQLPGDMVIDRWEDVRGIPYLFVLYASTVGERKRFDHMMDLELKRAMYTINPRIKDLSLEKEYENRL